MNSKKPAPKARATRRGTPVPMPSKPSANAGRRKTTTPIPSKPSANAGRSKMPAKPKPKLKMTPEDKAYNDLLNKYKGDITKIPGFKNGRGTM